MAPTVPVIGVPDNPRTGEPRIPFVVRVASIASYLSVANMIGALLWVYWCAIDKFNFADASWLMGQFDTEPGSLYRPLLAVGVTAIALVAAVPAAITGYYSWTGRRWSRISGLIAAALSLGSLTLNVYAWPTMLLSALAAGLLWTPPASRFFHAWYLRRNPEQSFAPPTTNVFYGSLPRYQKDW